MKQNDRELLERIREALSDIRATSEIADIEGRDVLTYYFEELSEITPIDCSVNVAHFDDGKTALQLMVSVFYDLSAELVPHVERLLNPLNSMLSIGSFCLMPEGYLYLNYTCLTDDLNETEMLLSLAVGLQLLTATAARARELLLPLVKGETDPNQAEADDFCISQTLG